MFRFVRHQISKVFVLLTIAGMVTNSFAYAAPECTCSVPSTESIEPTPSSCCSSESDSNCCSVASQCCCSVESALNTDVLCGCVESCGCGTCELPNSPANDPVVPCDHSQTTILILVRSTLVAPEYNIEKESETNLDSQAHLMSHSSQEMCALLSRFTC